MESTVGSGLLLMYKAVFVEVELLQIYYEEDSISALFVIRGDGKWFAADGKCIFRGSSGDDMKVVAKKRIKREKWKAVTI